MAKKAEKKAEKEAPAKKAAKPAKEVKASKAKPAAEAKAPKAEPKAPKTDAAKPAKASKEDAAPKAAGPALKLVKDEPAPPKEAKTPKAPKAKKPTKAELASSEEEARWQELFEKHKSEKAQSYDMKAKFESGKPLQHKLLGWGWVLSNENDRLEVLFREGRKMLISNYNPNR